MMIHGQRPKLDPARKNFTSRDQLAEDSQEVNQLNDINAPAVRNPKVTTSPAHKNVYQLTA
jgi:hypothetical protein